MKTTRVSAMAAISILATAWFSTAPLRAAAWQNPPSTSWRSGLETVSFLSPTEAALFGLEEPSIVYRAQDPPAAAADPFESEFEQWLSESPFAGLFSDAEPAAENTPPVLARAPAMFGDFFAAGTITASMASDFIAADMPIAGGSRRVKVAENNKALPVNRVFFVYNHFHNALGIRRSMAQGGATTSFQSASADRYTIGLERTMFEGLWSVELRMPFTNDYHASTAGFRIDGGNIGNLAIIVKRLVYVDDCASIVVGLGIDTPTGSDTSGALTNTFTIFSVRNQALHLLPYVGFMAHPTDRFFCHGFAQVDVATGANEVVTIDTNDLINETGRLREQTLMYLDASLGYWLRRSEGGRGLTGLAAVAEVHYVTALENADTFSPPSFGVVYGNPNNRFDVVNLTAGLHAEFNNKTSLRVAGVFPLDRDDRLFDAEVVVTVIRRF